MDVTDEKLIYEKGVLYSQSYTQINGRYTPVGVRPFHYRMVVWIGTLKFVFGTWDAPSQTTFDAMVEVSTGAAASIRSELKGVVTPKKLIEKYKEKLARHNKSGEQVVENFKSKFIQLWQTKFWAL